MIDFNQNFMKILKHIFLRELQKKLKMVLDFYKKNTNLINTVDQKYDVEKELLLALMGIETNYGTYVGKMDILSSLATLSFDKRRSEFLQKNFNNLETYEYKSN